MRTQPPTSFLKGTLTTITSSAELDREQPRRRRKRNHITASNNKFGRAGFQRCLRCRKRRQRCQYSSLDEPCTLCREAGFNCGADDKVLGPATTSRQGNLALQKSESPIVNVFRIITNAADQYVTDKDVKYISSFGDQISLNDFSSCHPRSKSIFDNTQPDQSVLIPVFSLSSKPFRFALLSFVAAQCEGQEAVVDAMQYIGKYYTYARELSDSSSIWEMVSSIYMAFVVENNVTGRTQNHGPFHNTALHFKGLWDSVWHSVRINALNADGQSFRIPGGEMILLTILSSFLWRCNSLRFREEQGWEEDAVGAIEAALRCFLSGFAFATPLQMLVALEYCFNIYWSCYRPASTESSINSTKDANNFISKRLKFILQQMRNLLSQIASGHDDTTTRLLMMIGWKRIEWAKQNLNLLSILSELTQGGGMEIYNLRVALVPRARDIFRAYCKSKSQYFNQSGFLCQAARALYWAWLVLVPDLTNEDHRMLHEFVHIAQKYGEIANSIAAKRKFEQIFGCLLSNIPLTNHQHQFHANLLRQDAMLLKLQFIHWDRRWFKGKRIS